MTVEMFDLVGDPSFEQMFGPVRPVLDRIIQDMKSAGHFSLDDIMQTTWLNCNRLVSSYNSVALSRTEREMLELSGACLATAANAIWMSFIVMNTVKALAAIDAATPGPSSVH